MRNKNFQKIFMPACLRSSSASFLVLSLVIIVLIISVFSNHAWTQHKIIAEDIFSYYSYLPSFFIRHDIALQFLDYDRHTPFNELWFSTSDLGIRFTKMPMGWSMMHLPFFMGAHAYAKISLSPADGFSLPYQVAISLSSLFYVCVSLILLRKLLLVYFSEIVVSLTLVSVVFATNLFYYTVFLPGMSHPISFFLFTSLQCVTVAWHKKPGVAKSITAGILSGLIVLTRASNIIAILLFIFYNVSGWQSLKEKFRFFSQHFWYVLIIAASAFIIFLPQLAYWKLISGHYMYYSYLDEHFFFAHPHIIDGLFGFRKGWLIYTPVMIFALLALFREGKIKEWMFGLRLFTILNIFIILSWWCWWYGGSYGARSFIESYAFLSLPLASFFSYAISKKFLRLPTCLFIVGFIFLNIRQTFQFSNGIIHYDSMTKAAYIGVFLKKKVPDNFSSLICNPDYTNAKFGLPERGDCRLHDQNHP